MIDELKPMGVPVVAGLGVVTTRDDWVVTVTHVDGTAHRRYCNASAERMAAISAVLGAVGIPHHDIASIRSQRRHDVEACLTTEDILRGKIK